MIALGLSCIVYNTSSFYLGVVDSNKYKSFENRHWEMKKKNY